jgi:hypothetical protein
MGPAAALGRIFHSDLKYSELHQTIYGDTETRARARVGPKVKTTPE